MNMHMERSQKDGKGSNPNWRKKESFQLHKLKDNPLFNETADIFKKSGRSNPKESEIEEYKRPGRNEAIDNAEAAKNRKDFFKMARYYERQGEKIMSVKYGIVPL